VRHRVYPSFFLLARLLFSFFHLPSDYSAPYDSGSSLRFYFHQNDQTTLPFRFLLGHLQPRHVYSLIFFSPRLFIFPFYGSPLSWLCCSGISFSGYPFSFPACLAAYDTLATRPPLWSFSGQAESARTTSSTFPPTQNLSTHHNPFQLL